MKKKKRAISMTTTTDSEKKAATLARLVVASKLAACAQYFQIRSVYRWKGRVEKAREFVVLMKTREDLAAALATFLRINHSYELPEITAIRIDGGMQDYIDWIHGETLDLGASAGARRRSRK